MSQLHQILVGDCIDMMRTLPDESVHTCVTSPPYYGLRDYGVDGQIGLEETPAEFIARLVDVFREVRRVLRADGTIWVNMGDSYASDSKWGGSTGGKHVKALHGNGSIGRLRTRTGLPDKNLMGMPWRLAFALQDDGWYLRQDIIWHKPNPMPESTRDRCTKAHEYLFLLSKSPRYY
ncbi:site-specific DNA-methyltransferase, partial [Pseudomonas syringae]